jgi:predicted transcriptional regulator
MSFRTDKLQELINGSGLTQAEIDNRLGVANGMVSKYVRGIRNPSVDQLYRFWRAIGWTEAQIEQERFVDWYSINGTP